MVSFRKVTGIDRLSPHEKHELDALLADFEICLKTDLLSIVVFGSLARGCYQSGESDIDLLVIATKSPSEVQKKHLLECVAGKKAIFDIVVTMVSAR